MSAEGEYPRGHEKNDPVAAEGVETALVIFADETTLRRLRLLRRGFRHCFVAVRRGEGWVVCNPFSNYTDLNILPALAVSELAEWYRQHGFAVIETTTEPPRPRCWPLRPFTCVEAVKRVLGVRSPWVFTPHQLFRYLGTQEQQRQKTNP